MHLAKWLAASLLVFCAPNLRAQTKNFATPQYSLPGGDYKTEAPAVNQMFRNVFVETQYLQKQVSTLPTTASSAGGSSTVTVSAPLSGDGSPANPVALTGAILPVNVNLSTVPKAGSCSLPNVVREVLAAGPTCAEPSDTTGNSATATGVAAGGTNQPMYQKSSGVTGFLPQVAAPGLVWGNGAAGPSTGTLKVGPNGLTVSSATGNTTLDLAQNLNSGASPTFNGANFTNLQAPNLVGKVPNGSIDGSTFSAIAGTQTVTWVSENFLDGHGGTIDGANKAFTLNYTPTNAASLMVFYDGLLLSQTSDYVYASPKTVTLTTAPTNTSTEFTAIYTINTSTFPNVFVTNRFSSNTVQSYNLWQSTEEFLAVDSMTFYNTPTFKAGSKHTAWLTVGNSTTPAATTPYVLISTNGAALLSPMSTTERTALTGIGPGALVYDTTKSQYAYYSGQDVAWVFVSTSSSGGGAATVFASTRTANLIPTATVSGTTSGPCILGSTLTMTTGANPVLVGFDGVGNNSSGVSGSSGYVGILIDGALVGNGAIGFLSEQTATVNNIQVTGTYLSAALSAGSHTFCLTTWESGGASFVWPRSDNGGKAGWNNQFWATEQ